MRDKISFVHSFGFKIMGLIVLASLAAGLLMLWTYAPNMRTSIINVSDHYMEDVGAAYASLLEEEIADTGVEKALSADYLSQHLAGVGIQGIDSSYIYVVGADGTMLYHPTADKIGKPVENAVVKGLVADIADGKKTENGMVVYDFKGVTKHAAIYVNDGQDFILIVTADEHEVLAQYKSINKRGWICICLIVVVFTLLAYVVTKLLTGVIDRLSRTVVAMSNMDFTKKSEIAVVSGRRDELGVMARAIEMLRQEFISVVDTIRNSSASLAEAAAQLQEDAQATSMTMGQVDHAVGDIAGGASSQAEETQRASENVIMIGDMVENTSGEVDHVMEFSKQMQEANDNAREILRSLENINAQAESQIDVIAEQTNNTNVSAVKIGEATKIITDIAEQTNLLSLNASIEAARAGEQGKGFAVVASEIQKLAEQSTASAKQIDDILNLLLADSKRAVETMHDVKNIIHEQSEYMNRTDAAFEVMNQGVNQSIKGMEEIAQKTRNLDDARVNVVDVVNNLTAIAEENAAATEQTSASLVEVSATVEEITQKVQILNEIAAELDEKMQVFQIG